MTLMMRPKLEKRNSKGFGSWRAEFQTSMAPTSQVIRHEMSSRMAGLFIHTVGVKAHPIRFAVSVFTIGHVMSV